MPKIRWDHLPRSKWAHLRERAQERKISLDDLFHLAVAMHGLGDEGHAKLFGQKEPQRVWSKDREIFLRRFTALVQSDAMVRSRWNPNPVFANAINLIALQLDNGYLPVFRTKEKW